MTDQAKTLPNPEHEARARAEEEQHEFVARAMFEAENAAYPAVEITWEGSPRLRDIYRRLAVAPINALAVYEPTPPWVKCLGALPNPEHEARARAAEKQHDFVARAMFEGENTTHGAPHIAWEGRPRLRDSYRRFAVAPINALAAYEC